MAQTFCVTGHLKAFVFSVCGSALTVVFAESAAVLAGGLAQGLSPMASLAKWAQNDQDVPRLLSDLHGFQGCPRLPKIPKFFEVQGQYGSSFVEAEPVDLFCS